MAHHNPLKTCFMISSNRLLQHAASSLKVQLSRQAGRLLGTDKRLVMSFEKEDWGGWFAVIPSWPGPKGALAMVDGADTFLDLLSRGENEVTLDLSIEPQEGWSELKYESKHIFGDGAYYVDLDHDHLMWLCGVTEFVFGHMPDQIWYNVVN